MLFNQFYIFNSRIATHVIFWILYYLGFSLIWSTDQGLTASFFLEFILLPIRIMAVYITIYILLPELLLKRRYVQFFLWYGLLILIAAFFQRIFIHLFYEDLFFNNTSEGFFSLKMLLQATVLINTTVFLVLSVKIFQLLLLERSKNEEHFLKYLELKSNRRTHRVAIDNILYIEGQGNYTTYHFLDSTRITTYGSVKKALENLPENFIRVHKSYIINRNEIKSFDANNVEMRDQLIPRGKNITDDALLLNL